MIDIFLLKPHQKALLQSNARFQVIHGGVGTYKTTACVLKLIHHCMLYPKQAIALAAQTYTQLLNVTVAELRRQLPENWWELKQSNLEGPHIVFHHPIFQGAVWKLRYADTPRAAQLIKGDNLTGYYITQAESLKNEAFFDSLEERVRLLGPEPNPGYLRLIDANPGAPSHFIRQRYIFEQSENFVGKEAPLVETHETWSKSDYGIDLSAIWVKTTPESSTYDQSRLDEWAKTRPQHEFQRMVMGEWVAAEGLVYDEWHSFDRDITPDEIGQFSIGIDPGTAFDQSKQEGNLAIVVIGSLLKPEGTANYGILDELVLRFQGLPELIAQIQALIDKWGRSKLVHIILDWAGGSGAVFKPALRDLGYTVFKPGPDKADYRDVSYGVTTLYGSLKPGRLKVNPSCKRIKRDLGLFIYGSDGKPDKKTYDSHLLDATRYCWQRLSIMDGWK